MFTQKVDSEDDLLGVYHEWISRLAGNVEQVSVVCLFEGKHSLPSNVEIFSLGKERFSRLPLRRFLYLLRFFYALFFMSRGIDSVFVHMNEEYVLLGGWWWRLLGKRVVFWRNHPQGGVFTKVAFAMSHAVLYTSLSSYAARNSSDEKGIQMPVGVVVPDSLPRFLAPPVPRLLYLGRISQVKHVREMVEAVAVLRREGLAVEFDIYGAPVNRREDLEYDRAVREAATRVGDGVRFHEPVPNSQTQEVFSRATLFLNLTDVGSMDKTIFESMAVGCPPVISNPDVPGMLPGGWGKLLWVSAQSPEDLAKTVQRVLALSSTDRERMRNDLFLFVREKHSLPVLIDRLVLVLDGK